MKITKNILKRIIKELDWSEFSEAGAPQRGHDASLADVKPRVALEEEMPTRDLEESKVTKSTLKRMVRQALARKHRKS